jgi:hypothetical protein
LILDVGVNLTNFSLQFLLVYTISQNYIRLVDKFQVNIIYEQKSTKPMTSSTKFNTSFQSFYGASCELPKKQNAPSSSTINTILNFSKSLNISRTKKGMQVEMVLN